MFAKSSIETNRANAILDLIGHVKQNLFFWCASRVSYDDGLVHNFPANSLEDCQVNFGKVFLTTHLMVDNI